MIVSSPPRSAATPLIAIDIGNSACKIGIFSAFKQEPQAFFRLNYDTLTPEVLATQLNLPLQTCEPHWTDLDMGLCSVAPSHEGALHRALTIWLENLIPSTSKNTHWQRLTRDNLETLQHNSPALSDLIDFSAYHPGQLGADRRMNMLAIAANAAPGLYLVIDAGTMTKFDLIDSTSSPARYLGGVISAGSHPDRYGAMLPELPQQDAQTCPGLTTQDALALGYKFKHGVHSPRDVSDIIDRLFSGLNWQQESTRIVLTGGDAHRFENHPALHSVLSCVHDPALTVKGIALGTRLLKDYNFVT
jgi:pantothenate kinase type III